MPMLRAILLASLLLAAPAAARSPGWFPHKSGECGWVHGRFAVANGSSVRRIWVTGTDHLISLRDDDDSAPPELDVGFGKFVFGDFFVCARDRFIPGHMQQVYIRKMKNLVSRPYGFGR
jgi:hypothetical protein